jgi:hypothetical protein
MVEIPNTPLLGTSLTRRPRRATLAQWERREHGRDSEEGSLCTRGVLHVKRCLSCRRRSTHNKRRSIIKDVTLEFDSGRLNDITFNESFDFGIPLSPYTDEWKNPPIFADTRLRGAMPMDAFERYLARWKADLIKKGFQEVEGVHSLKENEFSMRHSQDKFSNSFHLSFGPSRQARGGGLWMSGWHFAFSTDIDVLLGRGRKAKDSLMQVSAFNDEYNTVARSQGQTVGGDGKPAPQP